ncbi:MAG: CapA family protein [Myxococcota bacterium]
MKPVSTGRLGRWVVAFALFGCSSPERGSSEASGSNAASAASVPSPRTATNAALSRPTAPLVLVAGGDVSFGRMRGQRLLRQPARDDFASLRYLLDPADLRFVNLECTISDRDGETQHPGNRLVFTAPPPAAPALARAGIDIVSLANNHAWDYGRAALFETFTRLEEAGVRYVGAGRTAAQAYGPVVVSTPRGRVAFVAVTDIWNQAFEPHPRKEIVADAVLERLVDSVEKAKRQGDWVVVSHHGGYEYNPRPHQGTRRLLQAAVDAGADAVIGHHPHVTQRVSLYRGRPIFYSLGNLMMRMKTGEPWTQYGFLARLRLADHRQPEAELCLYRIDGLDPVPLGRDPQREVHERMFRFRYEQLLHTGSLVEPDQAVRLGAFDADGCAPVIAREP